MPSRRMVLLLITVLGLAVADSTARAATTSAPPPASPAQATAAPPTALPTPLPTAGAPSAWVCLYVWKMVPDADIARAMADKSKVSGWQRPVNPNVPVSPFNPLKTSLGLRNRNVPYNPLFNGLTFVNGCGEGDGGGDAGCLRRCVSMCKRDGSDKVEYLCVTGCFHLCTGQPLPKLYP